LTSAQLFTEKDSATHEVSLTASNVQSENKELATVDGVVNNDTVALTATAVYTAKYDEVTATGAMNASITDVKLDESVKDYILAENQSVLTNETISGTVHRREIAKVEVTTNPTMDGYISGQTWNASNLAIKVTYDSGEVVDMDYDAIVAGDLIKIKRADGVEISDGATLDCSKDSGNGQEIFVEASTAAEGITSR
jgi:hypothetical protein